jgi:predicted chitinase
MFNRKLSFVSNEKLTYKIVMKRIVKRFLLYYKGNHIGLDEVQNKFEIREIKNDVASFHLEVSHEIDRLNEMRTSLTQSMNQLNKNLKEYFDFEQIKHYLDKQKNS